MIHSSSSKSILYLCELAGISRQKYYRSFWSVKEKRAKVDVAVSFVRNVRIQMPRIGTRKLYYILNEEFRSLKIGRDKLFLVLKSNNMLIKPKKKYHKTTNSYHRFHKHKNLVENVVLVRPEQVFVSDITYIGKRDNHRYLSLVTDAYSKKIMGFDVSNSLSPESALRALQMAVKQRIYKCEPLIHHSDRGLQYCCDDYQKMLQKHKITVSMTESYSPYDNAVAERVNGILKNEFLLEEINCNLMTMQRIVKQSVSTYNSQRPHLSCAMQTPDWTHHQRELKIKTYKKIDIFRRTPENIN